MTPGLFDVGCTRGGIVLLVAVGALAACRIGGPSGDPSAYATFPDDGGADASTDDATIAGDDEASTPVTDAAGDDDALPGDSGDDAAFTDPGDDGDGCARTVPVCDPVHNTGCNPFQQCDVDPSGAGAGLCLFFSAGADAGTCTVSLVSETCPPKQTCASGACRSVCFCDSDCPAGQCCSDTSGPKGFSLCEACHG